MFKLWSNQKKSSFAEPLESSSHRGHHLRRLGSIEIATFPANYTMRTCWERWSWFQRKLKLVSCNFASHALAEQCAMSIIVKCNRDFFAWKLHSLTSCAERGWNCAFVAQRNGKLFEMQAEEIKRINKVTFNWSLRRFSSGISMFVSVFRIPAWNSCTWGIFLQNNESILDENAFRHFEAKFLTIFFFYFFITR